MKVTSRCGKSDPATAIDPIAEQASPKTALAKRERIFLFPTLFVVCYNKHREAVKGRDSPLAEGSAVIMPASSVVAFRRIEREPLHDLAHTQLREALLAGRFEPGASLTLRALAE